MVNWVTTSPFLNVTSFILNVLKPLKIAIGLNEERSIAG